MNKMDFAKGMGIGLAVGAAAGMMMMPRQRSGKQMLAKSARAMGDLIDGIGTALGF